jgi:1,4-dihydroxy-2-naphthoate octaprenyltransferase
MYLFFAFLTYALGAGIAHYIGHSVNFAIFSLGLLAVLTLLEAGFLLIEYFHLPKKLLAEGETFQLRETFRILLLQVAFAVLTLSFVVILTLLLTSALSITTGTLLVLTILLQIAQGIPPLRMAENGYGEIILAVTLGSLVPALAFLLQEDQFNRLLPFCTFPLTLLGLSCLLVGNFSTFATDLKFERHTLLTRLTWERAVPLHHLLVIIPFLIISAGPILYYPWSLVGPVFLALPCAGIQIILIQSIANGGRMRWKVLEAVSNTTFGLTAYLMLLTFWIR